MYRMASFEKFPLFENQNIVLPQIKDEDDPDGGSGLGNGSQSGPKKQPKIPSII